MVQLVIVFVLIFSFGKLQAECQKLLNDMLVNSKVTAFVLGKLPMGTSCVDSNAALNTLKKEACNLVTNIENLPLDKMPFNTGEGHFCEAFWDHQDSYTNANVCKRPDPTLGKYIKKT